MLVQLERAAGVQHSQDVQKSDRGNGQSLGFTAGALRLVDALSVSMMFKKMAQVK